MRYGVLLIAAVLLSLGAGSRAVADTTVYIPVLTTRLEAEAVVRHEDVKEIAVEAARLPALVIRDRRNLVGMAAKKPLEADRPLHAYEVAAPLLVRRGELVTMTVKSPMIQLTAQGRALENGAKGDVIRVLNTSSKKTVEGIVTAPGVVEVGMPASGAAAAPQPPQGIRP